MVITKMEAGFGNQFYHYAIGRYLAQKLNTELKLDLTWFRGLTKNHSHHSPDYYQLDNFNITAPLATDEEILNAKINGTVIAEKEDLARLSADWKNIKGDVYVSFVLFFNHSIYNDVVETLLKEFTLKTPLSATAETYKQKILAAECSVSLHLRYGNYAYFQVLNIDHNGARPHMNVTPISYAYTAVETLKKIYGDKKITVFVFSDSMTAVKENLHLSVPTEFIEGCESDPEEWMLMRLCQNYIYGSSCFSKSAILLNENPNKKVIVAKQSSDEEVQKYLDTLRTDKNFLLNAGRDIAVPCNYYEKQKVAMRPIFSILLVVNNDAATISATLNSILNQDYEYCEVIIIDNASTDGSGKICRQAVAGKENVTFKRFYSGVKNATAYNAAMLMAQGSYVIFCKGNDRFLKNTCGVLFSFISSFSYDIVHSFTRLEEDASGKVDFDGKKFSEQRDEQFKKEERRAVVINDGQGQDAVKLLVNQRINSFLGTKIFECNFLRNNGIKFDEHLSDDNAESFFLLEAFFKAKYFTYVSNAFYIAPPLKESEHQLLEKPKLHYSATARIDIKFSQTKAQDDFQILSVSDDKATVWKPAWFNKGGIGYQIQSYAGSLEIVAKATADGQIYLSLKGLDVREPKDNSKRIPYWIDYTKLIVNDKTIFDALTPTWHDEPYTYTFDAKADEEIKINVEWLPHKDDN